MKKSILHLTAVPITIGMLIVSCLLPSSSKAQYTTLLDLGHYPATNNTQGTLISDGTYLYGMGSAGGTSTICYGGCGTIFKIKPDGSGYSTLWSFNGTNGSAPQGSLITDGTFLYGMTSMGGSSTVCTGGCGTIFKIKPDGTSYSVTLNFNGTNGSLPTGNLISDGTFLYGMTSGGGTSTVCSGGCGTIFKIKPDGSSYSVTLNFNGTNGSAPHGSLISDGTFLYGMTSMGGTSTVCSGGCGTIFKIKPDGTSYSVTLNFNDANGSLPYGNLISDGTYLYGMTPLGGAHTAGTIFKIKPDGTGYSDLSDFLGLYACGAIGSLISDGTYFYGTEYCYGGSSDAGAIFRINLDGTGFFILYDYNITQTNSGPGSSLFYDGTYLYGLTDGVDLIEFGGEATMFKLRNCTPLTITESTPWLYNTVSPPWSTNVYSTITIGTGTSITATTNQDFKFSETAIVKGPFSSGTGGNTLSIVPTPCPQ